MRDHNLGELLARGLKATVNSDDPAYFGGYINQVNGQHHTYHNKRGFSVVLDVFKTLHDHKAEGRRQF
jgi:adenosine deaminase